MTPEHTDDFSHSFTEARALQNYSLTEFGQMHAMIAREVVKLWDTDLSKHNEHPIAKFRGLDQLDLKNKRVGILSAAPWEFSDYVASFGPKIIHEYQLYDLNGPLDLRTTTGNTTATQQINVPLSQLPLHVQPCDILWVPSDNFSNILIWNKKLLSSLSLKIRDTLVLPFMVSNSSLETMGTTPPFQSGSTHDHSMVLNDNIVRNLLHVYGFLQVENIKKSSVPYKLTRYHESKLFTQDALQPAAIPYDKNDAQLLYYYAHKLPKHNEDLWAN